MLMTLIRDAIKRFKQNTVLCGYGPKHVILIDVGQVADGLRPDPIMFSSTTALKHKAA
jgi:hypothetical protein